MEENEKNSKPQGNKISEFVKQGEYVYQLFSILIHSGSAMGGHYYAYIKSFEDGHWYNFNDSSVNKIPENEVQTYIQKMFGGGADGATSSYMLQYRRYDEKETVGSDSNVCNITIEKELVPAYLLEEIDKETEKMIQ